MLSLLDNPGPDPAGTRAAATPPRGAVASGCADWAGARDLVDAAPGAYPAEMWKSSDREATRRQGGRWGIRRQIMHMNGEGGGVRSSGKGNGAAATAAPHSSVPPRKTKRVEPSTTSHPMSIPRQRCRLTRRAASARSERRPRSRREPRGQEVARASKRAWTGREAIEGPGPGPRGRNREPSGLPGTCATPCLVGREGDCTRSSASTTTIWPTGVLQSSSLPRRILDPGSGAPRAKRARLGIPLARGRRSSEATR